MLLREVSRGWKNGEEWQRFGLDFKKSECGKVGLFKGAFYERQTQICRYAVLRIFLLPNGLQQTYVAIGVGELSPLHRKNSAEKQSFHSFY